MSQISTRRGLLALSPILVLLFIYLVGSIGAGSFYRIPIAVAFVVAMLAIKGFIKYVQKYGFVAFGWYRIIVGGAIIVMMLCGVNLQIA